MNEKVMQMNILLPPHSLEPFPVNVESSQGYIYQIGPTSQISGENK